MTNSIKLALVLVLMFTAIVSSAQSGETVAVYLKDGDVRIGRIEYTDSAGNVRLTNSCGTFNIKAADIKSMNPVKPFETEPSSVHPNAQVMDDPMVKDGTNPYVHGRAYQEPRQKGYYNITSVALLFGQGQNGFLPIPSLTTVNGWQINPKLYTGLGIGFEYYEWGVMPVFADVKYLFLTAGSQKYTPFGSMKLGWSFPIGNPTEEDVNYEGITKYQGGIQLNPEAGIRISMGNNNALLLSMGYHFQQLSYKSRTYYWWNSSQYESTTHTDYNRITFRLGFQF